MNAAPLSLPGPLFCFLFAILTAVVCYVVHRSSLVSGLLAAASCLALAWISLRQAGNEPLPILGRILVLDRPFTVLGRTWAYTPSNLAALTLIFFACGLAFLLALPASQGWSFSPFGMGVIAALVMAVTAQQYIYSILFLWLASVLAVFVLSGGRPGATTGAVRFLAFASMAAMLLLTLSGYLEPDADPEILRAAPVLLVLGFGILLMVVPFHGQLVAIAAHTAPMVPTFVLSVFPPVVFHILLTLGESQPALFHDRLFFDVCRWLGTAAVAIGGAAAAGQRRWGHLVGYAALVDWGAGLVALGQGTEHGVAWAVQMLGWRAASLLLTGTGLTIVYKALGQKDELSACGGMLQRRTTGVLVLVGGLLSLAGFPLTPGAVGRWTLIDSLLAIEPRTAWILILAGVGVCVGALNGLRACLGPVPQGAAEKRFEGVVAMVFSFLVVWLAGASLLYPVPWLTLVERFASSFSFPPV